MTTGLTFSHSFFSSTSASSDIFTIILRYRSVECDLRVPRGQRVGGSLLGHRSRHSSFSPGSSTSASSVRSLNSDLHNNTEVQEC
ncbi:hypothetical protein TNCV_3234471 [Trichonephila clavipes]|nr:hypothetical protein TNCV_3234471 [Trichonephila clavipes]